MSMGIYEPTLYLYTLTIRGPASVHLKSKFDLIFLRLSYNSKVLQWRAMYPSWQLVPVWEAGAGRAHKNC
jgi:hypothetical protein